ncbi:hypothetical protein GPDM_02045 [Planococcus donghaensis MPA1U2]|uniref:Squalene cyclase C-terminal domain-containing protein n=1 Tax=Planococcus donghaensis MPA1U2 TaxID=933115 RepID=E7RD81_9BACL|nr:hypothetical protein [Planococcus donghaensis]EGA91031.1 hypothetical protein GPDM_02045 [Planococcus donghaensis MPA1U2]
MSKLSLDQFEKAALFIKTTARPLEQTLFAWEFEGGSSEAIWSEVKKFQNKDGGFGHGLESDFRCEESSALATAVGLHLLSDIGVTETEATVEKGIQYLLNTFNQEKQGWQIVPRAVENAPRAIWWNYSEDWAWGNPTAEIIGLLHHYQNLVPADFLEEITSRALNYLNNLTTYEPHELLSFLKLYKQLPASQQAVIFQKLSDILKECVTTDSNQWDSYSLQPLQVVSTPNSDFYDLFKETIPENLTYVIQKQTKDGYWNPTWQWGQFEKEWEVAKQEWQGVLTLANLKILRAFNALETS